MRIAVLFWFIAFTAHAQITLRGRVINAADEQPVPFCSVFLANTNKGTTADENGTFALTNVPDGRYELVVSSVGFETWTQRLTGQSDEALLIRVKPTTTQLKEVEVNAFGPDWEKQYALFKQFFLGTSKNAQQCQILNPKAIWFDEDPVTGRLTGGARKPLVIENQALGYRIQYVLDRFEAEPRQQAVTYLGYPVFEDMKPKNRREELRWQRARLDTYAGSALHFLRALYAKKTNEQGFTIRRVLERPTDSSRVNGEWQVRKARYLVKDPLPPTFLIDDRESTETARALTFDAPIQVVFKGESEPPEYQDTPIGATGQGTIGRAAGVQTSLLRLTRPMVMLEANGNYYEPLGLAFEGYWGWEKVGDLLPLTYQP